MPKKREMEQWDRKAPRTDPHIYSRLVYNGTVLQFSGKKMVFAINNDGPLDIHMEKTSSDPYHNIHKN